MHTTIGAAAFQSLLKFRSIEAVVLARAVLEQAPVNKAESAERTAAVRLLGELNREQSRVILQNVARSDPNQETRTLAEGYI